jgi:hypothetical protein
MDKDLLREIAKEYLVPLFSGARLKLKAEKSRASDSLVALRDPCSIAFKVDPADNYRIVLTRSQKFAAADTNKDVVPEIAVVRAFVEILGPMVQSLSSDIGLDLLAMFQRRIVAKAISTRQEREPVLLSGIDQLVRWSTNLYEGSAISAAIGFRHFSQSDESPNLSALAAHDFSAVLSNGHDTLLEFDFSGRFISHISKTVAEDLSPFCPLGQAAIAEWTMGHTQRRRVALCLNRLNEILVIRDGKLLFARRSGRWHFITHEPIITQMGIPRDRTVRRAIYETCLDVSFARTGACIGVVLSSQLSQVPRIVNRDDLLERRGTVKTTVISKLLRKKKFQDLDRRLRRELAAIDGATVIKNDGTILAVGAILKIPGGSSGGGRRAAAQVLGKLGLGIKVSQDGGITGFRMNGTGPAFQVL